MIAIYILSSIALIALLFAVAVVIYTKTHPQFGGKHTAIDDERFKSSKQWNGKIFENRIPVVMDMNLSKVPKLIAERRRTKKMSRPQEEIVMTPFDKSSFLNSTEPQFIWYGHSVILMRIEGKTIFIDPMMGDNASPIAPFKTERFTKGTLELIDDLPEIDILCMSHDHYDHLDYHSIQKLKHKTKHFYTALGVAKHLRRWGVDDSKITEMDWQDEIQIDSVKLIFTESRHFSGRGFADRFKCLWGGWIVETTSTKIYWSGDGGYGTHFKEIGEKYGPFDIGFMECGQYNPNWKDIHLTPEESVQAAIDANVKTAMPVHCMGFALATHPWQEPMEKFYAAATINKLKTIAPKIGAMNEI